MSQPAIDVKALVSQLESVDRKSLANDDDRRAILAALNAAHARLETPYETILRWDWIEPQTLNCVKIAHDVRLFHALDAAGGSSKTSRQLAQACSPQIPEELAMRVMRHLAATRIVLELDVGLWGPTELSSTLTTPDYEAGILAFYQTFVPTFSLPEQLRDKMEPPYTIPTDPKHVAWSIGKNMYGTSMFDVFALRPKLGKDFADLMRFFAAYRKTPWEIYPFEKQLLSGARPESKTPFFVDLGGSTGHDLKDLRTMFPQVSRYGDLVDLDRPDLIAEQSAQLQAAGIVGVGHDFFKPYPAVVHGARGYMLRQIIHDWPDHLARDIISRVRDAMEPGYSRLLLHDSILPDKGADPFASSLDMIMMSNLAAKERSDAEFRTLVESVDGLKVEHIYRATGAESAEGIMDIVRVR